MANCYSVRVIKLFGAKKPSYDFESPSADSLSDMLLKRHEPVSVELLRSVLSALQMKILSTEDSLVALQVKSKGLKQMPLAKGLEKRKCKKTVVPLGAVRVIKTTKAGSFSLLDGNRQPLYRGTDEGKEHVLGASELLVGFTAS